MPSAIAACKFVGTISLGLFTGVSYTLGTLTFPSLLSLPSAKPAHHVFIALHRSATLHLRALATLSILTLNTAFALSPARARHPYLLWTSLAAGLAAGVDLVLPLGGQPLDGNQDQHVNGEMVEQAVRAEQMVEGLRAALGAAGFAMSLVGLWGDGA